MAFSPYAIWPMPGDAGCRRRSTPSPVSFNPRPARVPGDAACTCGRMASVTSFNPRPARVPGDANARTTNRSKRDVSIRARHACRAMLVETGYTFTRNKVSIRARHACRAMHERISLSGLDQVVSIRARHACRAMQCPPRRADRRRQPFQSAPGTRAGRCPPPLRVNTTMHPVSIRARHACRAMPGLHGHFARLLMFQSAPGTRAGRCPPVASCATRSSSFNPRPARVPGDAARWLGINA